MIELVIIKRGFEYVRLMSLLFMPSTSLVIICTLYVYCIYIHSKILWSTTILLIVMNYTEITKYFVYGGKLQWVQTVTKTDLARQI